MKKTKIATAGILGAIAAVAMASAASAADLPRKSAPVFVQPVPIFTWTGFYVGVNGGYAFGPGSTRFDAAVPGLALFGTTDSFNEGFTIGGTIGYNFQVSPNFVVGIEADLNYIDGDRNTTFTTGFAPGGSAVVSSEMNLFGTVRGRLGLTFDRFMVYATGGLAYANIESNTTIVVPPAPLSTFTGSKDDTRFGWTLGAGVEYAFTNNLSAKVEYLYYDLGDKTYVSGLTSGPAVVGFTNSTRVEASGSIVRAGLNYRF
jgi:outer membrane immunogenic protein